MSATHMPTPVGLWPIRESSRLANERLSDKDLADKAIGGRFIDPEAYAELCHRGLSGPGVFKDDTYRMIEAREET